MNNIVSLKNTLFVLAIISLSPIANAQEAVTPQKAFSPVIESVETSCPCLLVKTARLGKRMIPYALIVAYFKYVEPYAMQHPRINDDKAAQAAVKKILDTYLGVFLVKRFIEKDATDLYNLLKSWCPFITDEKASA